MSIQWVESVPSGTSLVGHAPGDFKSVWTAIATAMAREHFWPGSGGGSDASAGDLLPGATRCFADARSRSSVPSQGTARFFMDTTNSRLFAYDSTGTFLAGTSWYEEMGVDAGSGYWVRTAGNVASVPTASGTTIVTFPVVFVAGPPVVLTSSNASWTFSLVSSTTTNFTSAWTSWAGAAGTATLYWEALGTLSTASY